MDRPGHLTTSPSVPYILKDHTMEYGRGWPGHLAGHKILLQLWHKRIAEAITFLKEAVKTKNQKLLGITLSKSIDAHELQFLEEKIRLHEHPTTNEGDKERLEIERQMKVDSLEENKYNLSSQIRNWETKLESLEERQSENIEESAELKKSRKDHELKKAKMEVCILLGRRLTSSHIWSTCSEDCGKNRGGVQVHYLQK